MVSPMPPYSSGIDIPNRPSLLHLLDQVGGDLVGLGDLGLEGNQTFPDEAGNGTEEDVQRFLIPDHGLACFR